LSIIDGITSIRRGEGVWNWDIKPTSPVILNIGLNPVFADAVATSFLMGYPDPRAAMGTPPFLKSDNHILLAEQTGVDTADLSQIESAGSHWKKPDTPLSIKINTLRWVSRRMRNCDIREKHNNVHRSSGHGGEL
jgi:hypothetical protein